MIRYPEKKECKACNGTKVIINSFMENEEDCPYCYLVYQYNLAIDETRKLNSSEWISVEDRLPEKADWYSVYTRNLVTMLFLDNSVDNNPCWLCIEGDWSDEVTHWQPLPEPPEKGGSDGA